MKTIKTLIITALMAFYFNAVSQDKGDPVSIGTYEILHSDILNEDRRLLISLPDGYEENNIDYPVIFLLYGGQVKGYFAEIIFHLSRLSIASDIPPMILVGIENTERYRDNLPVDRNGNQGGADNFQKFFSDELIPYMDSKYKTKDFRILIGPQAGATFGLYSLLTNPELFDLYYLTNPFWIKYTRDLLTNKSKEVFTAENTHQKFVYFTYRDREGFQDQSESARILESYIKEVNDILPENIRYELNHEPVNTDFIAETGFKKGVKLYFANYDIPDNYEIECLDDIKAYYKSLSDQYGFDVDIPEFTIVKAFRKISRIGDMKKAMEIIKYAYEMYPASGNTKYHYADMNILFGNMEIAKKLYKKMHQQYPQQMFLDKINSITNMIESSAAYAIEQEMKSNGIKSGQKLYNELKQNNTKEFNEQGFNRCGYHLVRSEKYDLAIELFKIGIDVYPEADNLYDSMAETYLLKGDKKSAKKYYQKALEINPEKESAINALKDL